MNKFIIIFIFIILFLIPLPKKIKEINSLEIYDSNNNLIYREVNENENDQIKYSDINEYTIKALLFMEDNMFYKHHGFNIYRTLYCSAYNIFNNKRYGASTITQQLAKNLFLSNDKTLIRKLKELRYSINLELKYCKEDILAEYLSIIYFSNGIYGIKGASSKYFHKQINDLTLNEAISLFLISKSPNYYNPYTNYDCLMKGKNLILKKMLNKNLISNQAYQEGIANVSFFQNNQSNSNDYYFINEVKRELFNNNIYKNVKVYTSFDKKLMDFLSDIKLNDLEHSIIILNRDNKIISLLGGNNYNTSLNHIHQKRSIASLIKPFICYNALIRGMAPDKEINTSKQDFYENDEIYSPSNYNNIYPEYSNMIYSLATSSNIYSILMRNKYLNSLEESLNKFNLSFNNYISLALGTTIESPYNMAQAYSVFFNDGIYKSISCINKITDLNNKEIKIKNINYSLNSECSKCIKSILNKSFDKSINYSTLSEISDSITSKTMAKTGTDDYNSWVIGFSDEYLVAIWEGYDKDLKINKADSKIIYKKIFNYLNSNNKLEVNKLVKIYNDYYDYIYYPSLLPKIKGAIF